MTCVINDSDPKAVENKQGTAKEQEQKRKREEKKGQGGLQNTLKDIGLQVKKQIIKRSGIQKESERLERR